MIIIKIIWSEFFLLDIHIGFSQSQYEFFEPDRNFIVRNVTLIKEANHTSEQTFSAIITIGDPAMNVESAQPEHDFSLGTYTSIQRWLRPTQQYATFHFNLYSDDLPEKMESFLAHVSCSKGYPTFHLPNSSGLAFATTEITIRDNDCELMQFMIQNVTLSFQLLSLDSNKRVILLVRALGTEFV